MAAIEDLIKQIADPGLRDQLAAEVARLKATKTFGLVFEEHLPELVRLPALPVRAGVRVMKKDESGTATYRATSQVNGQKVKIVPDAGGTEEIVERDGLVVAKAFGEPMYPALVPVDAVERAPGKPWHVLINADNYHALQLLLYGYEGKVDVIYIDPPYNTGARDWKYNNNYVDDADLWRHSKWLSMMKKRLELAKRLLKVRDSVLIVTIDEKEYARLGLLLEEVFDNPTVQFQMVSTNVNPAAASRAGRFGRSDEYIYFVMQGCSPARLPLSREWVSSRGRTHTGAPRWDLLRRSGSGASRDDSPGCFYPIYVDLQARKITRVGDPLPKGTSEPAALFGSAPILPIRKDASEGRWMMGPTELRSRIVQGRVRVSLEGRRKKPVQPVLYYLADGEFKKIEDGEFSVRGFDVDGSMMFAEPIEEGVGEVLAVPSTQWRIASHDSTQYGTRLLAKFIPGRKFPYPKSLYAVEDTLRFFVHSKLDALVLDFFAGSGTTAHAVARLNKQDGGRRRSILVSNNEVASDEEASLASQGLQPGMPKWEALGIFEYVTRPRVVAAFTGRRPDGKEIDGDYSFTDVFPMSDGFEENAAFFKLDFLDPGDVTRGEKFESIAPILWMLAGCRGACEVTKGSGKWFMPKENPFAVLHDEDAFADFVRNLAERPDIDHVFLVTDSTEGFHEMAAELGGEYKSIQLYRSYIDTFRINLAEPGTISPAGVPIFPTAPVTSLPPALGVIDAG